MLGLPCQGCHAAAHTTSSLSGRRWGLVVTSSEVYPFKAQRSVGLGSRTASVFLSCPSDIHRAAPLLRQCVLQGPAKDPQAVYQIQGKEVRVDAQLIPYVYDTCETLVLFKWLWWLQSENTFHWGSQKKKIRSPLLWLSQVCGTPLNTFDLLILFL